MELPFHLKTLEPLKGALDIIRYLDETEAPVVNSDDICERLDLSERSFSKAIRRLVTKGYVVMDGDMDYRLTDQGMEAAEELAEYDEATGGGLAERGSSRTSHDDEDDAEASARLARRLVLAIPTPLSAGRPENVLIGVHDAAADAKMGGTAEMVARVSVINGNPATPEDLIFSLGDGNISQTITVTPANFSEVRIRIEVFQLGDNPGDIYTAGGMYVDVPVSAQAAASSMTAYGTDIQITKI